MGPFQLPRSSISGTIFSRELVGERGGRFNSKNRRFMTRGLIPRTCWGGRGPLQLPKSTISGSRFVRELFGEAGGRFNSNNRRFGHRIFSRGFTANDELKKQMFERLTSTAGRPAETNHFDWLRCGPPKGITRSNYPADVANKEGSKVPQESRHDLLICFIAKTLRHQ